MPRNRLIILGIVILLVIYLPGYIKLQQLKAQNKFLLTQIEKLKKNNIGLAREIKSLENDPIYIEKKARDKMGVSKKGEIIYKVTDSSKESNE